MVRLTVNLEEELYELAKSMAIADNCSLNAAINKLLRRATQPGVSSSKRKSGFPVVRGKRKFTSEEVYKIDQL